MPLESEYFRICTLEGEGLGVGAGERGGAGGEGRWGVGMVLLIWKVIGSVKEDSKDKITSGR